MWLYHVPFTICVVSVLKIAFCDNKKSLTIFYLAYPFLLKIVRFLTKRGRQVCINLDLGTLEDCTWQTNGRKWMTTCFQFLHNKNNHMLLIGKTTFIYTQQNHYSCMVLRNQFRGGRGLDRMVVKSPKQSLGDLLFLLRFLLLLFLLLLFFSFSFLSADHEFFHGRSQELLDRISWNLVEL